MTESITETTLSNYNFKRDKPIFTNANYNVYNATQNQTNVPVTIKILRNYHLELPKYLKKLKDCKSENVIKVYETISDSGTLLFITERVNYGNLANGLIRCERLDDVDSIYMSKMILNGHIDLLRSDCNWFGTEEDIEFTDSGVKLSWNNSIGYNMVNPFPKIIQRISMRPQDKAGDANLLPFPKNKNIIELIRISQQNASQISLNPQMKKKEKTSKKKGKNWFALKEYRNKNQYFDEYSYLAVSDKHGIIKVKVFESGKINPHILALNKTKRTFTKVIDTYEENGKTIIMSEYSNDGNLQAYVSKLKSSGIQLTEDHIEFFFYSLFQPLKQVQESVLKSINMLHIKNIYIQNGIPKIGQPIPLNSNIESLLTDRNEVPDFYHKDFKQTPTSHKETYDTYSLGVLLYKLMYTQYPIFPKGKVHIPTTPNYNKRLKTTLQIFLNEGGKLKEIENRIEVSENVKKQVKQNKQKLVVTKETKKQGGGKGGKGGAMYKEQSYQEKQSQSQSQKSQSEESEEGDHIGCCTLCCQKLQLSPNEEAANKNVGVIGLQESPYRIYRICTKMILSLLMYIFLFYFFFLQNDVMLIANQNLLTKYDVTISTITYSIITTDANKFDTTFGKTRGTVSDLLSLDCLMCNYQGSPDYSEFLYEHSQGWVGYIVCALLAMIVILLIKLWQIYKFDIVRAVYNRDHAKYNFNMSHFIIFQLLWASLIHGHFYLFNFVFTGQTQPCVGGNYHYGSTESLFNDRGKFTNVYMLIFILQLVVVMLEAVMIGLTYKVKYNKLVNPLIFFVPVLISGWVILRVGVVKEHYYPSMMEDSGQIRRYFTKGEYVSVLGIIPQILILIQLLIGLVVDVIYWMFLDKRRRMLINENSAASLPEL